MNIVLSKIIGIIIGLLLAYVVKIACDTRNCIIYNIPNPAKIEKNVYKLNDKCYKLKSENTHCNTH